MFRQFVRSCDDNHPDAHAVRLRLVLAVMYSPNVVPWSISKDLLGYLHKLPHVSQTCRLTYEEEVDAIMQVCVITYFSLYSSLYSVYVQSYVHSYVQCEFVAKLTLRRLCRSCSVRGSPCPPPSPSTAAATSKPRRRTRARLCWRANE